MCAICVLFNNFMYVHASEPEFTGFDTTQVETKTTGCTYTATNQYATEDNPVVLAADYSHVIGSNANLLKSNLLRGPVGTVTVAVNNYYWIYITTGKDCFDNAQVHLTGSYTYEQANDTILSANLSASLSSVPSGWQVSITNQYANIYQSSLSYTVSYYCYLFDPADCMVGGGGWYSAATFTLR